MKYDKYPQSPKYKEEENIDWQVFWIITAIYAVFFTIATLGFHWQYAALYGYGWGFCWLIGGTGFFGMWIPTLIIVVTDRNPGKISMQ